MEQLSFFLDFYPGGLEFLTLSVSPLYFLTQGLSCLDFSVGGSPLPFSTVCWTSLELDFDSSDSSVSLG